MTYFDLDDYSNKELREIAEQPERHSAPMENLRKSALYELGQRKDKAETALWNARMEVQYAENRLRDVLGIAMISIVASDGFIHSD